MHISINEFIEAYQHCCSNSRAANENGKRFEIVSQENFTKLRIDGGVITSQQEGKCDYGFARHSNNDFYFVELKGSDIETALNQIINTIRIFENSIIKIPKNQRFGFVVSSKFPKTGLDSRNLQQRFMRDYGKSLKIQNRVLKHIPE